MSLSSGFSSLRKKFGKKKDEDDARPRFLFPSFFPFFLSCSFFLFPSFFSFFLHFFLSFFPFLFFSIRFLFLLHPFFPAPLAHFVPFLQQQASIQVDRLSDYPHTWNRVFWACASCAAQRIKGILCDESIKQGTSCPPKTGLSISFFHVYNFF